MAFKEEWFPSNTCDPREIEQGFDLDDITSKSHYLPITPKTKSEPSTKTLTLLGLPLDIIKVLFDCLSACTSACLGLTCKPLYAIHYAIHGPTPLYALTFENAFYGASICLGITLYSLLHNWMKPSYVWDCHYTVFRPRLKVNLRMGLIDQLDYWNRRTEELRRLTDERFFSLPNGVV